MANLIMDWLSSHYAVEHPPSPLPEKMSVFQERTLTVLTTNFPSLLHRLQPISILPSSCLKMKPKPAHPETPRLPAFAHPGAPASPPSDFSRGACASSQPCRPSGEFSGSDAQYPLQLLAGGRRPLCPTPRRCSCWPSSWMTSSALLLGWHLSFRIFSAPFQEILPLLRGRDLS